jgi:hypothetical protein
MVNLTSKHGIKYSELSGIEVTGDNIGGKINLQIEYLSITPEDQ